MEIVGSRNRLVDNEIKLNDAHCIHDILFV